MNRKFVLLCFIVVSVFFLSAASCNDRGAGMSAKACHDICIDEETGTQYAIAMRGLSYYADSIYAYDYYTFDAGCYMYAQALKGEWDPDTESFVSEGLMTWEEELTPLDLYTEDYEGYLEDGYYVLDYELGFLDAENVDIGAMDNQILFSMLYASWFDLAQTDTAIKAVFYHKIDPCVLNEKIEMHFECGYKYARAECTFDGTTKYAERDDQTGLLCHITGGDCRDDINWNIFPEDWKAMIEEIYDATGG
jgi:hypothetical protein